MTTFAHHIEPTPGFVYDIPGKFVGLCTGTGTEAGRIVLDAVELVDDIDTGAKWQARHEHGLGGVVSLRWAYWPEGGLTPIGTKGDVADGASLMTDNE